MFSSERDSYLSGRIRLHTGVISYGWPLNMALTLSKRRLCGRVSSKGLLSVGD